MSLSNIIDRQWSNQKILDTLNSLNIHVDCLPETPSPLISYKIKQITMPILKSLGYVFLGSAIVSFAFKASLITILSFGSLGLICLASAYLITSLKVSCMMDLRLYFFTNLINKGLISAINQSPKQDEISTIISSKEIFDIIIQLDFKESESNTHLNFEAIQQRHDFSPSCKFAGTSYNLLENGDIEALETHIAAKFIKERLTTTTFGYILAQLNSNIQLILKTTDINQNFTDIINEFKKYFISTVQIFHFNQFVSLNSLWNDFTKNFKNLERLNNDLVDWERFDQEIATGFFERLRTPPEKKDLSISPFMQLFIDWFNPKTLEGLQDKPDLNKLKQHFLNRSIKVVLDPVYANWYQYLKVSSEDIGNHQDAHLSLFKEGADDLALTQEDRANIIRRILERHVGNLLAGKLGYEDFQDTQGVSFELLFEHPEEQKRVKEWFLNNFETLIKHINDATSLNISEDEISSALSSFLDRAQNLQDFSRKAYAVMRNHRGLVVEKVQSIIEKTSISVWLKPLKDLLLQLQGENAIEEALQAKVEQIIHDCTTFQDALTQLDLKEQDLTSINLPITTTFEKLLKSHLTQLFNKLKPINLDQPCNDEDVKALLKFCKLLRDVGKYLTENVFIKISDYFLQEHENYLGQLRNGRSTKNRANFNFIACHTDIKTKAQTCMEELREFFRDNSHKN